MKIVTDFWGDENYEFTKIALGECGSHKIVFQADLSDKWETVMFFKRCAKFVSARSAKQKHLQFFVIDSSGNTEPVVWFKLVISDSCVISHDYAFATPLIKRNGVTIPFGRFCFSEDQPVHRHCKMKNLAYRFIANQVLANFEGE